RVQTWARPARPWTRDGLASCRFRVVITQPSGPPPDPARHLAMLTLYRVYHRRTPIEKCSPIVKTLDQYSASLWLYYRCLESLKAVISINTMRCIVELIYMPTLYSVYHLRTPIEKCSPIMDTLDLYSASLWLYYGCLESLKAVISINKSGCIVELIYMSLHIYCVPVNARRRVFRESDVGALVLSLTMSGICWFVNGWEKGLSDSDA
ncbi:bidirectional sugar transporter SWEET14, partial [Striga asiatica]